MVFAMCRISKFFLIVFFLFSSYLSVANPFPYPIISPLLTNHFKTDSAKTNKKLIIENKLLKEQLASITDSLRARTMYEEALNKQKSGQQELREKLFSKQALSLQEKDALLIQEKSMRRRLALTGLAFAAISIFTIAYLRLKYKNSINVEAHRVEIAMQREKEIKQGFMIENISGRIEAQEAERERISRELHDGIGGNLVAIRLQLQSMDNDNPAIEELQRLVAKTHEEIRSISHNLATPRLDETPFEQLFFHHIRHLNSNSGQSIDGVLLPQTGWSELNLKFQTELFRLIQELSGNIIKHSKATKVTLTLRRDSNTINLLAEDNGIGFVTDKGHEGIGLQNIKLRVKNLNGSIDLTSSPGTGTIFIIEIPYIS